MNLKYEIEFLDYWHLGSGLSAGASLDSSVIKDSDELPYLSGKTLKGLAREMAELLGDCTFVNKCFGGSSDDKDICYDKKAKNIIGECYFGNATIDEDIAKEIITNKLQNSLYSSIASTQIKDGIAVTNSLREIEVVIPITLYGEILDIPDEYKDNMMESLKMIKRMGLNRNRGLGRCEFKEFSCKS